MIAAIAEAEPEGIIPEWYWAISPLPALEYELAQKRAVKRAKARAFVLLAASMGGGW